MALFNKGRRRVQGEGPEQNELATRTSVLFLRESFPVNIFFRSVQGACSSEIYICLLHHKYGWGMCIKQNSPMYSCID